MEQVWQTWHLPNQYFVFKTPTHYYTIKYCNKRALLGLHSASLFPLPCIFYSVFYHISTTWEDSNAFSIACSPSSSSTAASSSTASSSTQLYSNLNLQSLLDFPSISLVRKVRNNYFVLHGVRNMIGSTTMLVLMLHFVTCGCEMNMRRSKFLASKKCEPAFLTNRFTYWKEATIALNQHQSSHLEAIESLVLLHFQIQGNIRR